MSRLYLKINEDAYDLAADEYAARLGHYKERDKKILEPFIDFLKERFEKPKLLELGPGSGLALEYFEKSGFETFAIDISQKILDVAKNTSPKTTFYKGDFLSYPFDNKKFDGIFGKAFIHLFPKEDALLVLKKIKTLLSHSGLVYLSTTMHEEALEGFLQKEDYDKKPKRFRKQWTEKELTEALEETGFEIIFKDKMKEEKYDKIWMLFIAQTKF